MSKFTDVALDDLKVGDIVEDSYGNAAVVYRIDPTPAGTPRGWYSVRIMQMAGSDRGRTTSLPTYVRRIEDPELAESYRETARAIWRERGAR